jgi:hypothetical protein
MLTEKMGGLQVENLMSILAGLADEFRLPELFSRSDFESNETNPYPPFYIVWPFFGIIGPTKSSFCSLFHGRLQSFAGEFYQSVIRPFLQCYI